MQAEQPSDGQPSESVSGDGRAARSVRTRRAIVDALRALHHEGDLRPTAPRVAERAGVSVRTVWQHFDDLETLLFEAGRRDLEIAQSFVAPIDMTLPTAERVDALVQQRARMFEEMAPPWRAARVHAPFSAQIQSNRDTLMQLAREQVGELFAPELAGASDPQALLDALHVASSWATWESLRADAHLDVDRSKKALRLWLSRLIVTA
jgi:TetR/AcrR family transcriptional regulator, regulator of autoinduction and epiphytic fitness